MQKQRLLAITLSIFFMLTVTNVLSDSATRDNLDFSTAISLSLDQLEKSPYKSLEVQTVSGTISGDFFSKSQEVLVLKTKTNNIHMKSGKEKIVLTYINISKITSISIYVLSD